MDKHINTELVNHMKQTIRARRKRRPMPTPAYTQKMDQ
ncbi:hypothetical protein ACNKHR_01650 [Shigella flexneri]